MQFSPVSCHFLLPHVLHSPVVSLRRPASCDVVKLNGDHQTGGSEDCDYGDKPESLQGCDAV
jgi:hypothetical protein